MSEIEPATGSQKSTSVLVLDTTAGSIIHKLFGYLERAGLGQTFSLSVLYIIVVSLTFLPLLIGAMRGPHSLVVRGDHLQVPFFFDLDILFALLVSLPGIVILIVTDQHVLTRSLKTVQLEGTITFPDEDKIRLGNRWKGIFWIVNLVAQTTGIVVGGIVAYINYRIYDDPKLAYWLVDEQGLLEAGYIFIYCIFVFYAFISIYVVRNIAISLLLEDIVEHAQLHLVPLHPDRCWGLRPIGRLGLRNQYALTLLGINVVLLGWVIYNIGVGTEISDESRYGLVIAAVIAYLILGPVVFIVPLLPFRSAMQANKSKIMSEVVHQLRKKLDERREELPSGMFSKEDEELIERLRKLCVAIDDLPVWPFDPSTVRKFLTAYVIPVITAIPPFVQIMLSVFKGPHQ